MLDDWLNRNVSIHTTEGETITGVLAEAMPQGVVIEMNLSKENEPPFESLVTDVGVLLFIPLIRIKGISKASYEGIR